MEQTLKKAISVMLVVVTVFSMAAGIGGFDFGNIGIKANAATISSKNQGDIVEFGLYPQTLETDSSVIEALNNADCEWISYGYYSGTGDSSDGQMISGDYMRYADVSYGANKYRGVVFDSYRPQWTGETSSFSLQIGNGYYDNEVYWFKYEPIKWRVLDPANGLVLSEVILDSQAYNNYVVKYGTDEYGYDAYWGNSLKTYYSNNYEMSSIREWLNNDFLNTAFSSTEQSLIGYTDLENRAFNNSYSAFDSEPTSDRIFLLSCEEVMNADYGFVSSYETDSKRTTQGSDYSKCQGLQNIAEISDWRLRSTGYESHMVCSVYNDGSIYVNGFAGDISIGIRPAMSLDVFAEIFEPDASDSTSVPEITTAPSTTIPATTVPSTSSSYDENPTVAFTGTTTEDNAVYGTYGIFEYKIDNGEVTIIKCDPEVRGKILIPDTIEGYPVTELGYESFYPCSYITELIIPGTVKKIGADTFSCGFTNITIPESVTEIGYGAFDECGSLEAITVDENNRRYSSDEFGVLFDKNKTTLIRYPSKCSETNYKIPESVLKIDVYAFVSTDVEYVTVPKSVAEIAIDSFWACKNLREINVDGANAEYSSDKFGVLFNKDKTKLLCFSAGNSTKNYVIPEGVEEIEICAFGNAVNLESVVIPEGVKEIGYCTFADCYKLKSVILPEGFRVIGDQAFVFCERLENIYIPYGAAKIEWLAFRGCTNLEYVHIPETVGYIGETILLETENAYICSYTEDCYAKMYAEDNGYEFRVCDNHGSPIPEPTTQPTPSTTQTVPSTTQPTPSTTQPVPSTTKPLPSITKPVTTKPTPVEEEIIKKPSTSTVNYGETLILHADFANIPEGAKIEWSVEGDGVSIVPSEDGKTCSVTSNATGDVTIVAKYTDSNGVEHVSEQNIESKAGLWQKIVYFIKTIFGIPTVIPQAFKFVF